MNTARLTICCLETAVSAVPLVCFLLEYSAEWQNACKYYHFGIPKFPALTAGPPLPLYTSPKLTLFPALRYFTAEPSIARLGAISAGTAQQMCIYLTLEHVVMDQRILLIRAGALRCGFALTEVDEVMRPLAIKRMAGMPDFVHGVSIIRGEVVPVVNLGALLVGTSAIESNRLLVMRAGARKVAIAVDDVEGVADLPHERLQNLPPLLQETQADLIERIGALDRELLLVLEAARVLPESVWETLATVSKS